MRTTPLLIGLIVAFPACDSTPPGHEGATACGSPATPTTAVARTTGDFDGDGGTDRAVLYEVPEVRRPLADGRRVRIDLADGTVVDDPVTVESPLWIGAADGDGDGRDELFTAGAGNTVEGVTLAGVAGCRLVEVTLPDGSLFVMAYGARGLFGGLTGGWCADDDGDGHPEIVVTAAEPDREALPDRNGNGDFDLGDLEGNSPYPWTRTVHRLDGTTATPVTETTGRADGGDNRPELTNEIRCGPVDTGRAG